MKQKLISSVTRRNIADALTIGKYWYNGRFNEADFLSRIFDLNNMESTDHRSEYNTAYKDIHKHTYMNQDWEPDWVFTDPRLNLTHCDDETYLRFLCETIHPIVRSDTDEIEKMLEMYNKILAPDGFEITQSSMISGKPVFSGGLLSESRNDFTSKKIEIKQFLNTDYVDSKITVMVNAVKTDTDLAIGTAKELLETICKSILKQKNVSVDKNWTLQRLIKETSNSLNFRPKDAEDPEKAEQSIKQILGGISAIVQGVSELRNSYGTGHGKNSDFKGLEVKYAKLLVGVVSEIAIIFLATNGEPAELITQEDIF